MAGRKKERLTTGKLVFGMLLLECHKFQSDEERGKWILSVANQLTANDATDEFAQDILDEARGYKDDDAERKRIAREEKRLELEEKRRKLDRPF